MPVCGDLVARATLVAMHDFRFDTDTSGEMVDQHRVAVRLDPDWNVDGRILNGGYLQAVAVRAAAALLGDPGDPVAVSTSFAAPAEPGAAEVAVQVLRRGRRLSAVSATLAQADTVILATLATFGSLPVSESVTAPSGAPSAPETTARPAVTAPETTARPAGTALPPGAAPSMPAVPGPEGCLRIPADRMPGPPGLAALVDLAFVPEDSGWLSGDTAAGPAIRCWLSFADQRDLDPLALTALVDMAPPVSFALGAFGWAPTLHLQVGVFARPRGRHVLLDLRGEPYDGAFVAEDGLLWDGDGTLVARSRQKIGRAHV